LNYICIKCFGDGYEGYVFGSFTGAFSRSRNALTNLGEPLSYLFGHRGINLIREIGGVKR